MRRFLKLMEWIYIPDRSQDLDQYAGLVSSTKFTSEISFVVAGCSVSSQAFPSSSLELKLYIWKRDLFENQIVLPLTRY